MLITILEGKKAKSYNYIQNFNSNTCYLFCSSNVGNNPITNTIAGSNSSSGNIFNASNNSGGASQSGPSSTPNAPGPPKDNKVITKYFNIFLKNGTHFSNQTSFFSRFFQ
jgi:hypothetical protein